MSYGCFNRAPFKSADVRHGISSETGERIVSVVPFRLEPDCMYALNDKYADKGCIGCCHRDTALEKRKALAAQKVS